MKKTIKTLGIILMLSFLLTNSIQGQDIEAKLKTDDGSSNFIIKNNSDYELFKVNGSGNFVMGSALTTENVFFYLRPRGFVGEGEHVIMTAGDHGKFSISAGNSLYYFGGEILLDRPLNKGGDILLKAGSADDGIGGDLVFTGGNSGSGGGKGGDIKFTTGSSETSGYAGSFTVMCRGSRFDGGGISLTAGISHDATGGEVEISAGRSFNGPGGSSSILAGNGTHTGGDVHITAGNVSEDAHAGDIHLKPGICPQSDNNGYVIVYGNLVQTGNSFQFADSKMREKITSLTNSLTKINRINPIAFEWRSNEFSSKRFDTKKQIGLNPIEVETYYPELVNTDKDGIKSIDYTKLSVVLLQAIKEQQKEIEELKEKVAQISNK